MSSAAYFIQTVKRQDLGEGNCQKSEPEIVMLTPQVCCYHLLSEKMIILTCSERKENLITYGIGEQYLSF